MRRGSSVVLVLALCTSLSVTACSETPRPQVADLERIVPSGEDAPSGLRFAQRLSGPADLEAFRGDPQGRAAMQDAGFRSAWTALFASPDLLAFFSLSEPKAAPPDDARLLTASAVLFDDEAGAERALHAFATEATGIRDPQELPEPSPGPGFAIEGTRTGARAASFGMMAGEVVVLVQTQGAVARTDALEILGDMRAGAIDGTS